MTIIELFEVCETDIKVLSARTGRVMAYRFKPDIHGRLAKKDVIHAWAKIEVTEDCFENMAKPVICVYVPESDHINAE